MKQNSEEESGRFMKASEDFIKLYIIIIFTLFQFYFVPGRVFGLPFKLLLYSLITMLALTTFVVSALIRRIRIFNRMSRLDVLFLFSGFLLLICILLQTFFGKGRAEIDLTLFNLLAAYFLVSQMKAFKRCFLKLLLVTDCILAIGLFYAYFSDAQYISFLESFGVHSWNVAAFAILFITISMLMFCTSTKRREDGLSLFSCTLGFLVLLLTGNMIGVWLIIGVILSIPVLFIPTLRLVKRDLLLLFLFLFTWSNMGIFTEYTQLLPIGLPYQLTGSLSIDIALFLLGIGVIGYRERIPREIPEELLVLNGVQKVFRMTLKVCLLFFLILFTAGDELQNDTSMSGNHLFGQITAGLLQSGDAAQGSFYAVADEYGPIGLLLFILFCSVILTIIRKNYCKYDNTSTILTVITIVYFAQAFFFGFQMLTSPIYIILITFALNERKTDRLDGGRKTVPYIIPIIDSDKEGVQSDE